MNMYSKVERESWETKTEKEEKRFVDKKKKKKIIRRNVFDESLHLGITPGSSPFNLSFVLYVFTSFQSIRSVLDILI